MPILKASIKSVRQTAKRYARLYPLRTQTKTYIKKLLQLVKEKKLEEAKSFLPKAYKIIDMATKRNIFHPNNGARKKSLLARNVASLEQKTVK